MSPSKSRTWYDISRAQKLSGLTPDPQVTSHHEDLLGQAASASELSGSLVSVKGGLSELEMSLEKCVVRSGTYAAFLTPHL